jgi:hypothetical protein
MHCDSTTQYPQRSNSVDISTLVRAWCLDVNLLSLCVIADGRDFASVAMFFSAFKINRG